MVCPKCLHAKTQVVNSRASGRTNHVWRRRRCLSCSYVFSTREYIEAEDYLLVQDATGEAVPFSRTKLLLALAGTLPYSPQKPDNAFYLMGVIEQKLLHLAEAGIVTASQITAVCLEVLQRFDTKAYLKYLATSAAIHDARDLRKLLKKKPTS